MLSGYASRIKQLMLLALIISTFGCTQGLSVRVAPPLAPLDNGGQIKKNESFEKRVNYATTRVDACGGNKSVGCDTLQRYETGNDKTDPATKYGYVTVRIPYNKKIGETKGMNVTEISADIGWEEFKKNISADDILIYVHGYNTTFNNAAVRSAQLAFDLNYKGVPVFFSWPSDGKIFGVFDYGSDKQRASENFLPLAQFLINIAENTDKKIHIVSHSMGAYILTHALAIVDAKTKSSALLTERKRKNKNKIFNQVVFAAPDIANDEFRTTFKDSNFKALAHGFTLYSIKNDEVLKASRIFNKFIEENGETRLGDSSLAFFTIDGMSTIDARDEVVQQVIGHSYYAEDERLVTDLFLLFNHESKPENRMLIGVKDVKNQHFWFLRP